MIVKEMSKERVAEINKLVNHLNNDELMFLVGQSIERFAIFDFKSKVYIDIDNLFMSGTKIIFGINEDDNKEAESGI